MFNQGVFLDILKIAKVNSIFESRKKSLFEIYLPIFRLPTFSQEIENLIKVRILSFIYGHNIQLCGCQNGFRKKRFTMYPLSDVIAERYDNIINKSLSCIITLGIN